VTPKISRRRFILLALTTGLAVGCTPPASAMTTAPQTNTPASATGSFAGMRFRLENDSIAYAAHPRGCDATTVRGYVHGADGAPMAGMVIRMWADDPAQTSDVVTADDGIYSADIAQGTPKATYHLQLMDPARENRLSDVIIAEATGSCNLNTLTVNFVPETQ
jgi:hypothetical protein